MAIGALKKITAPRARDVCAHFDLGEEAKGLLDETIAPGPFLELLIEKGHLMDAIRLLAFALPKREAVWWACLCAREMLAPDAPAALDEVIKAAETWVYKPTEENRRLAMEKAEKIGFDKPASWAAIGAFWSGGSMAPPAAPVVPPAETLTAKAVSGAILLAAVQREPERAPQRHRQFLDDGIDIAMGGTGRKRKGAAAPPGIAAGSRGG
jgi:hypothetical protein